MLILFTLLFTLVLLLYILYCSYINYRVSHNLDLLRYFEKEGHYEQANIVYMKINKDINNPLMKLLTLGAKKD